MGIKEKAKDVADKIQKEGEVLRGDRSKDKQYVSSNTFPDEEAAKRAFMKSRERLFDVNGWSDIPGIANSTFTLYTATGQPLAAHMPKIGDYIKIDLPGPVPLNWVEVTDVTEGSDLAEFTVKPASDPTKETDKNVTDHFFHDKARSTFRVERRGHEVLGMEIGINEGINKDKEEAGDKALVNTIISETGWAFFQENQWKNLTDYLVGIA